jgi:DsbC/DsbD-like thiol-disulfide interchange protein
VNSDKPKDEYLIPLKLTLTGGPLQTESISYPKPEMTKVGDQELSVFTGSFSIEVRLKAPASAPKGHTEMTGKLRYQACNSDMCFRPSSADVKIPVVIE